MTNEIDTKVFNRCSDKFLQVLPNIFFNVKVLVKQSERFRCAAPLLAGRNGMANCNV